MIRDHEGQVIKAGVGRCDYLLDAFHAEVLACKAGIARIVVETDSLLPLCEKLTLVTDVDRLG
jgi:hypothetical protein